jgi:hypothetical protein
VRGEERGLERRRPSSAVGEGNLDGECLDGGLCVRYAVGGTDLMKKASKRMYAEPQGEIKRGNRPDEEGIRPSTSRPSTAASIRERGRPGFLQVPCQREAKGRGGARLRRSAFVGNKAKRFALPGPEKHRVGQHGRAL